MQRLLRAARPHQASAPTETPAAAVNRVSTDAANFVSAATEYLCRRLLEAAGDEARSERRRRVQPRHVARGAAADGQLRRLLPVGSVAL